MSNVASCIEDMYLTMESLARFGAADTEPRAVFAEILRDIKDDRIPKIPATSGGWYLFSDMEGSEQAALTMHDRAKAVEAAAADDPEGLREAYRYRFGMW